MKNIFPFSLFAMSFIFFACTSPQENWTQLRGSTADGISASKTAPVKWSETENIVWKTPVAGRAWSSPIVYGNQIWVSSATDDGTRMFAVCIDFENGQIIQEIDLFQPQNIQRMHPTNSYATPTPCIEKGFVYMHFGTYGTACIDTKKMEVVWQRTDLNCEHMQGAASSPVLYENLLIVHLEGTDVQFIAALDKKTGQTVWKTNRPSEKYEDAPPVYRKSFQTPLIVNVGGKHQLISNGSLFCMAYEPETGKEIWRLFYGEDSTVAMPLFFNGMVYVNSGWVLSQGTPFFCRLYAVDPTGAGNITDTHVKWMSEEHIPQTSTPVIVDSLMYGVTERGMVSCRDAASGQIIWTQQLKGHFDASIIYAAGYLYFSEEKGTSYVIEPGRKYQPVAENTLDGKLKATPVILRNCILMRTDSHLYKIAEQK